VAERPVGGDAGRRTADHPLGVVTDGVHLARAVIDRHHRGLREDDAVAADVDDRVRGAEVDRDVAPGAQEPV
jgi:hypothetical protein